MKAKRKENCIGDVTGYTKAATQVILTAVQLDPISAKDWKQIYPDI